MYLVSPIWLLALVPWGGLVIYLLWGRPTKVKVPFLALWEIPDRPPPLKRSLRPPPLALALMLLALLSAVLAAARPMVPWRWARGATPLTLIVDRGITMSAAAPSGLRYRTLARNVRSILSNTLPLQSTNLYVVPGSGSQRTDLSNLASLIDQAGPTAMDTRSALRALVQQRLRESSDQVLILTDQVLDITDDRLIQVPPDAAFENLSIVHLALRAAPRPQLLVRLRNDSSATDLNATLTTAGAARSTAIKLPARGQQEDCFLDLPALGPTLHVHIDAPDALAFDNHAWLVRTQAWPRIEPRGPIPQELQRMIDTYARLQPPGEASPLVWIVRRDQDLPPDQPGVILALPGPAPGATRPGAKVSVVPHALTEHVDWARTGPLTIAAKPPAGFRSVVSVGDAPAVAVRESPARQVWVGFDAEGFSRSPAYPVFWKDVFDFVGRGGENWSAQPVGPMSGDWKLIDPPAWPDGLPGDAALLPGLYRNSHGELRAVNALDVHVPPPIHIPWQNQLARWSSTIRPAWSLASPLLLMALALIVLAALTCAPRSGRVPAPSN